jgi:hypothetical protein
MRSAKLTVLIILCLCAASLVNAQPKPHKYHRFCSVIQQPDTLGLRSDTIDVLNYTINLNYVKFSDSTIGGNTIIHFAPKMNNIKTITLDLLGFKIDSIKMKTSTLSYSYNDTIIIANLPLVENIGDTSDITVYYHGVPHIETSGAVGGFFFEPPYAFNMGEAVTDQPHTYGRAWYPCFDNFKERATYTFNITTTGGNIAYCNGYLAKDTTITGNRTRTWRMNNTMPPYLASIDVAPYIELDDTYKGIDTIPIVIAALPADTHNIHIAFVHLKNAITIYQNCYGTYPWCKVGYSMVGPNGGSMEHASNIAFPASWMDGTLGSEPTIVHELSHHWTGDLVTCRTANDMWLNEGFATYNEYIFEEYMYGEPAYQVWHRYYHEYVLHLAHIYDNGYRAMSPMASPYTFSTTTYDKGGDVVGTLRGYMGDSAFFKGLKYYVQSHAYQPVTSDTLKHSMERSSGMNLTNFFNNWVYAPGFPHFSIDSVTAIPSGLNYSVTIYVKQKLTGAPAYYTNVPLLVTFKSATMQNATQSISISGHISSYNFTVPFKPVFAALNFDEKISEAIAPDTIIINSAGKDTLLNSRFYINVTSISGGSAFLYIEHNYTAPDPVKDTSLHYRLSPNRYWKISGLLPTTFKATATLYYDATPNPNGYAGVSTSNLDNALANPTADSIILLYRKNTGSDWKEFPGYARTKLSTLFGYMTIDSVPMGEYTFANGKSHVIGIDEHAKTVEKIKAYPNPAAEGFTISLPSIQEEGYISVYNVQGKLMQNVKVQPGQKNRTFETGDWNNGTYIISLNCNKKQIATTQVVVSH